MNANHTARKTNWLFIAIGLALVVVLAVVLRWSTNRWDRSRAEHARSLVTRAQVDSGIHGALELHKAHMGRYPTAADGGLSALLEYAGDARDAQKWQGPYARAKDLKDAWRVDLIYRCPGEHNEGGYDLSSAGPDGRAGTEDDIVNWDPP